MKATGALASSDLDFLLPYATHLVLSTASTSSSNCLAWSTRCRISTTRQRSLTAALTYLSKCSAKLDGMPAPRSATPSCQTRSRSRSRVSWRSSRKRRAHPTISRREVEAFGALAEKLDLRRAEPDEVLRRHGNRPVDTEDRDLEFVSRLDRIRQHDQHVEALDRGRASVCKFTAGADAVALSELHAGRDDARPVQANPC